MDYHPLVRLEAPQVQKWLAFYFPNGYPNDYFKNHGKTEISVPETEEKKLTKSKQPNKTHRTKSKHKPT